MAKVLSQLSSLILELTYISHNLSKQLLKLEERYQIGKQFIINRTWKIAFILAKPCFREKNIANMLDQTILQKK